MSYIQELNALRREVRQSTADTLSWWPKLLGQNVDVSATPADNIFTVHDPDGVEIQASTNATRVAVAPDARLDLSVPSIGTLGEDYQIRLVWTDLNGDTHKELLMFDVVLVPFGPPSVSLNAMREERADIADYLVRLANKAGFAPSATTDEERAETAAGIFAVRARVELDQLIRLAIVADAKQYGGGYDQGPNYDHNQRFTRPRLILNRERLEMVERKLACKLVFANDAQGHEDGEDESARLFRHFKSEAEAAWKGVGPLRYDRNEDLQPDVTLESLSSTVTLQRV